MDQPEGRQHDDPRDRHRFWLFTAAVLLEGLLFVLATSIVSVVARRSEFALLRAVGWPASSLRRLVLLDGAAAGVVIGALAVFASAGLALVLHRPVEPVRLAAVWTLTFLAYAGGTALALPLVQEEGSLVTELKAGEVTPTGRRHGVLAVPRLLWHGSLRRRWRFALSIGAAAVPAFLLALLLHISLRLDGIWHLSWAGEYISLEVQPQHYLAGVVALVLTVVLLADLMALNVSDRRSELALLLAVGWRPVRVRLLVLAEGAAYGLASGLLGLVGAWLLAAAVYGHLSGYGLLPALGILALSATAGALGAAWPSELAVRVRPGPALQGL